MNFLFYLFICITFTNVYCSEIKILGDSKSTNTWVYLCGLKQDVYGESTPNEESILNDIGTDLGIKFIAIEPPLRCECFCNKLCWPYENKTALQKTYEYISSIVQNEHVSGYLGFSNGGFFLLELAQNIQLSCPIIAIGAAGVIQDATVKNQIILLIGKYDVYHYSHAKQFYKQLKKSCLDIELIEYEDGHCIPKKLLYKVIKNSIRQNKY